MVQPSTSDLVPAAERAASLFKRMAQLEAVLTDHNADDIERRHATASPERLAHAASNVELTSSDDDDDMSAAAMTTAKNALAALMRRVADYIDPPERAVSLTINEDWVDSAMAWHGIPADQYNAEKILDQLELSPGIHARRHRQDYPTQADQNAMTGLSAAAENARAATDSTA